MLKEGASILDKRSPTLTLEPNKNYWDKSRIPKATFVFDNVMSKAEALEEVAKGGKVDIVTEVSPAEAIEVAKSKKAHVVASKSKTILVGVFNENAPNSKWLDADLRRALNETVDRKALVRDAAKGYGSIIASMITPGSFGYDASLKSYGYAPDTARKKLAAAGVTSVTVVASESQKPIVEALTTSMAAAGVKVVADYTGKPKADGSWDLWLVEHFDWSPDYSYGVVSREFFGKDGGFRKMPEDPKFEALGAKIVATPDPVAQKKLVMQMDRYIHDQANVLFLYAPSKLFAVSNRVNFVPYRTTMLELAETTLKK